MFWCRPELRNSFSKAFKGLAPKKKSPSAPEKASAPASPEPEVHHSEHSLTEPHAGAEVEQSHGSASTAGRVTPSRLSFSSISGLARESSASHNKRTTADSLPDFSQESASGEKPEKSKSGLRLSLTNILKFAKSPSPRSAAGNGASSAGAASASGALPFPAAAAASAAATGVAVEGRPAGAVATEIADAAEKGGEKSKLGAVVAAHPVDVGAAALNSGEGAQVFITRAGSMRAHAINSIAMEGDAGEEQQEGIGKEEQKNKGDLHQGVGDRIAAAAEGKAAGVSGSAKGLQKVPGIGAPDAGGHFAAAVQGKVAGEKDGDAGKRLAAAAAGKVAGAPDPAVEGSAIESRAGDEGVEQGGKAKAAAAAGIAAKAAMASADVERGRETAGGLEAAIAAKLREEGANDASNRAEAAGAIVAKAAAAAKADDGSFSQLSIKTALPASINQVLHVEAVGVTDDYYYYQRNINSQNIPAGLLAESVPADHDDESSSDDIDDDEDVAAAGNDDIEEEEGEEDYGQRMAAAAAGLEGLLSQGVVGTLLRNSSVGGAGAAAAAGGAPGRYGDAKMVGRDGVKSSPGQSAGGSRDAWQRKAAAAAAAADDGVNAGDLIAAAQARSAEAAVAEESGAAVAEQREVVTDADVSASVGTASVGPDKRELDLMAGEIESMARQLSGRANTADGGGGSGATTTSSSSGKGGGGSGTQEDPSDTSASVPEVKWVWPPAPVSAACAPAVGNGEDSAGDAAATVIAAATGGEQSNGVGGAAGVNGGGSSSDGRGGLPPKDPRSSSRSISPFPRPDTEAAAEQPSGGAPAAAAGSGSQKRSWAAKLMRNSSSKKLLAAAEGDGVGPAERDTSNAGAAREVCDGEKPAGLERQGSSRSKSPFFLVEQLISPFLERHSKSANSRESVNSKVVSGDGGKVASIGSVIAMGPAGVGVAEPLLTVESTAAADVSSVIAAAEAEAGDMSLAAEAPEAAAGAQEQQRAEVLVPTPAAAAASQSSSPSLPSPGPSVPQLRAMILEQVNAANGGSSSSTGSSGTGSRRLSIGPSAKLRDSKDAAGQKTPPQIAAPSADTAAEDAASSDGNQQQQVEEEGQQQQIEEEEKQQQIEEEGQQQQVEEEGQQQQEKQQSSSASPLPDVVCPEMTYLSPEASASDLNASVAAVPEGSMGCSAEASSTAAAAAAVAAVAAAAADLSCGLSSLMAAAAVAAAASDPATSSDASTAAAAGAVVGNAGGASTSSNSSSSGVSRRPSSTSGAGYSLLSPRVLPGASAAIVGDFRYAELVFRLQQFLPALKTSATASKDFEATWELLKVSVGRDCRGGLRPVWPVGRGVACVERGVGLVAETWWCLYLGHHWCQG